MVTCQENPAHSLTCVHWSTILAPTWNTVTFESLVDDTMCRSNANVQHSGNCVHRNMPVLTNKCVHVSNVSITDGCAQMTWVVLINDRCSAFLKSFYTLVHFPFSDIASTILLNHSSVNPLWFHFFDDKNLITEGCSPLVQFSSGAAMILALLFESCLSCHQLHAVRTCPVDVSALCSFLLRLCPVLLNIQSVCPYLKSPHMVYSFVLCIVTGTGRRYPSDKDGKFEILMIIDSWEMLGHAHFVTW
jgi:hypothetical protein